MAFEVLSDAKSKEEYDLYLKSAKKENDYWSWQAGENENTEQKGETKDEDDDEEGKE